MANDAIWRAMGAFDRLRMRLRGGAYLNTMQVYGTYRCFHRSHLLGLRCLRSWRYDMFCGKHNGSCWSECL